MEEEEINITVFSTIYGRTLIGEIVKDFTNGVEMRNVFLLDNQHPEGMVPMHQDSVMEGVTIYLRNSIIETESRTSEKLRNEYISICLKHLIIKMTEKEVPFFESNNQSSKSFNNIKDSMDPQDLYNQSLKWRNKHKNN